MATDTLSQQLRKAHMSLSSLELVHQLRAASRPSEMR